MAASGDSLGTLGPTFGRSLKSTTGHIAGSPYHDKRIQSGLSTQIIVKVQGYNGDWYTVGAIKRFQVSESRNLVNVQEVGTEGIVQIHPQGAQPIELTVERLVFDYQRLTAALQRGFGHITNQRFPFDIVVLDYNPYSFAGAEAREGSRGAPSSVVQTRFVNCWFKSLGYSYEAENYQISESANLSCETVYDTLPAGVVSRASSGLVDAVELEADTTPNGAVMVESYVAINNLTQLNV
jgi:hypothetical protein